MIEVKNDGGFGDDWVEARLPKELKGQSLFKKN